MWFYFHITYCKIKYIHQYYKLWCYSSCYYTITHIKLINYYLSFCQCSSLNSFRLDYLVLSGILVRYFSMQINTCWIKIYVSANAESFQILITLPMVFWPPTQGILTTLLTIFWFPTHGILIPLPMVYWTAYPCYVDTQANGVTNPLSMVYWTPTHGILTPYPWYFDTSIHGILIPYPWHINPYPW